MDGEVRAWHVLDDKIVWVYEEEVSEGQEWRQECWVRRSLQPLEEGQHGEKGRGGRVEAGGMELNQEAESAESNCQGWEGGGVKDTIWVSDIHDRFGDTDLEVKAVLGATEVMGIDTIAREQ